MTLVPVIVPLDSRNSRVPPKVELSRPAVVICAKPCVFYELVTETYSRSTVVFAVTVILFSYWTPVQSEEVSPIWKSIRNILEVVGIENQLSALGGWNYM